MATNQVFLPSQIVPNLWGSHRGLFEGLSLLGPPSCSASWAASLVEWVTAVPTCQNVPGLSQTLTKSILPSGAAKTTPDSGKKPHQSAKQAAGYSGGMRQERKKMQRHGSWKRSAGRRPQGPPLSLGDHEDSIANLLKWAPPSLVTQPPSNVSSSGSKRW